MKNKGSNMKTIGILLVLILMLMVGLIYINNLNSNSSLSSKQITSLELISQVEAQDKGSTLCSFDDLLAEASGTLVVVQNTKGESIWNKHMTGKVTGMKSAVSNLYILDSSKRLYCISKKGQVLWDKQLEGEIKGFYIDRSGDVLVEYAYNNNTKVQIFSSKGIDEGSLILENAYFVTFASGKEENSISVIDISSDTIKTKILTLNLKGDMIWSENIDNQVIPLLGYNKDQSLIAVGEKSISIYKDKSKKPSEISLNKTIYNGCIGDEGIVVVVRGKRGFEVLSYDLNLKELGLLEREHEPKGIILGKSNYILYYDEMLFIADLRGKLKAEFKSIPEINKAYFGSDDRIFTVSDRLMQEIGIK